MQAWVEFGKPQPWAYPTLGMLRATGTPLPKLIRVLIHGCGNMRIDVSKRVRLDDDDMTDEQLIAASLVLAGFEDCSQDDFVTLYIYRNEEGYADVSGYILTEHCIRDHQTVWDDETDDDILEAYCCDHELYMDIYDYDLKIQRL